MVIRDNVLVEVEAMDLDENGVFVVPEEVTVIGEFAFRKELKDKERTMQKVTGVKLHGKVTEIGKWAFDGCKKLVSVNFPEGLVSIGDYAFAGCENLDQMSLPETLTYIGEHAFSNCFKFTDIELPSGITTLDDSTFAECKNLQRVKIPKGITKIGSFAFSRCENLTDIEFPEEVENLKVGHGVFRSCKQLKSIKFPKGLKSLGGGILEYCTNLEEITLPDGLESIDDKAFIGIGHSGEIGVSKNLKLKKINIPNGTITINSKDIFYDNQTIILAEELRRKVVTDYSPAVSYETKTQTILKMLLSENPNITVADILAAGKDFERLSNIHDQGHTYSRQNSFQIIKIKRKYLYFLFLYIMI